METKKEQGNMKQGNMSCVVAKRTDLLQILYDNKEKHNLLYDTSMSGYYKKLGKELGNKWTATNNLVNQYEKKMTQFQKEGKFSLDFKVKGDFNPTTWTAHKPVSHESDYNKAIRMLELSIYDDFALTSIEFDRYVMNNWEWKASFISTTSNYCSNTAYWSGGITTGKYSNVPISGIAYSF